MNEDVHIIVSSLRGGVWVKPSREINRHQLIGLLIDAIGMMQASTANVVKPEDCQLRAFLTVDDEQPDIP